MPTTDSTATGTFKFAGVPVTLPLAYSAGHVLTAPEALFLSRKVASTVGNSFGHAVTVALEAANANLKKGEAPKTLADLGWDVQAKATEAFTAYRPGEGRSGSSTGPKGDPVAAMVNYLATEAVKAKIARNGLKVMDFYKSKVVHDGIEMSAFKRGVLKHIAAHPELHDQAAAIVAQNEAASTDDDLLDVPEVQAAA